MAADACRQKPELLYKLVTEAPEAIQWLNNLGVEFDKAPDGTMITTHGGGISASACTRPRTTPARKYAHPARRGSQPGNPVVDYTAAIELI